MTPKMTPFERIQRIEGTVAERLSIPRERVRAIFYLNEDLKPIVICEIFGEDCYATAVALSEGDDDKVIEHLVKRLQSDYASAIFCDAETFREVRIYGCGSGLAV